MKIRILSLPTTNLSAQKKFYCHTLGFDLLEESVTAFTLKIGWSMLTFYENVEKHHYHFCFLVPSNKLNESLAWMQKRVEIVEIDKGEHIVHFDTWNAHSFYFYDPNGNIAEFIVRHDLENTTNEPFGLNQVICINEVGLGTNNPKVLNSKLEQEIGSTFWKGDLERFATNGSQEGLFLLPNYNLKDVWFPSQIKIKPEPIHALIENNGELFKVSFIDNEIEIKTI